MLKKYILSLKWNHVENKNLSLYIQQSTQQSIKQQSIKQSIKEQSINQMIKKSIYKYI